MMSLFLARETPALSRCLFAQHEPSSCLYHGLEQSIFSHTHGLATISTIVFFRSFFFFFFRRQQPQRCLSSFLEHTDTHIHTAIIRQRTSVPSLLISCPHPAAAARPQGTAAYRGSHQGAGTGSRGARRRRPAAAGGTAGRRGRRAVAGGRGGRLGPRCRGRGWAAAGCWSRRRREAGREAWRSWSRGGGALQMMGGWVSERILGSFVSVWRWFFSSSSTQRHRRGGVGARGRASGCVREK